MVSDDLVLMMVDFMCQLDWTKDYQVTGKVLFLAVFVRMLPEEISSWSWRKGQWMSLPLTGQA